MLLTHRNYPTVRMRRLRQFPWLRELVSEVSLQPKDLILPLFIREAEDEQVITKMPGVLRHTVKDVIPVVKEAYDLGIRLVALFPFTPQHLRDETGSQALNPDNLVCRATKAIKDAVPDMGIMVDVALDPHTSHGHDGLMGKDGTILNDATIEVLCEQALVQARSGVNIVSPSEMMDGRIGQIRKTLDRENFENVLIMSYAAKFSSSFYGPFRNALGSEKNLKGNKHTYFCSPRNPKEAIHDVALDVNEGADMLIVRPGLAYLDILAKTVENFGLPTYAYQVSGEYAMLKAAQSLEFGIYEKLLIETLFAFKRAGGHGALTYGAIDAAKLIHDGLEF